MKRISLLAILIFITGIMFSCSDTSGSDSEEGYIDPGLTAKTIALKSYDFADAALPSCATNEACGAIIFSGELNKNDYVGFAAGKDSSNPGFSLKVYWNASSIPSSLNTTSYSIIINDGTYTYTIPAAAPNNNLNISISSGSDGSADNITVYTIDFLEDLTVSDGSGHTVTIAAATDMIVAYKY